VTQENVTQENATAPVTQQNSDAPTAPVTQENTAASTPTVTQDNVTQSSQVVDAATHDQPSQEGDFFDDIDDYEMITIEEIIARDIQHCLKKRGEEERVDEEHSKLKKVKIEKVVGLMQANWKATKLYHGKQRRSSERINAKWLSKPIVGVGSSQSQPIVVNEHDDDAVKLGTLKSRKNLPKKK
jgi:hypothetical protein